MHEQGTRSRPHPHTCGCELQLVHLAGNRPFRANDADVAALGGAPRRLNPRVDDAPHRDAQITGQIGGGDSGCSVARDHDTGNIQLLEEVRDLRCKAANHLLRLAAVGNARRIAEVHEILPWQLLAKRLQYC